MACLISYDIVQAFNESSITDENLLQFVKELYKEGFIKVNVEYNEWTGANYIIYSMTASRTESETYPIELGLNTEDIKPISKGRFTEACKEMGIECSTVEGQNDCVTLKFKNKAEVYAMQDYFKDWKNYSQAQFCNFFPELKKCFTNNPSVPVAAEKVSEGVSILGVRAINESVLYSDSKNGTVNVVLPYTEDYAKMFGYSTGKSRPSHINIVTESFDETKELYKTLSAYASTKGNKIDEDASLFEQIF